MIYSADWIQASCVARLIDGKWVAARPESGGFIFTRIKAAFLVLTGKADAVVWAGQP